MWTYPIINKNPKLQTFLPYKIISTQLKYFKSEEELLLYILLYTDGKTKTDALGITDVHYTDKKTATMWYNSMNCLLNATIEYPEYNNAKYELDLLYYYMLSNKNNYDIIDTNIEADSSNYESYLDEIEFHKFNKKTNSFYQE